MKLSQEEVLRIARLARLGLSQTEVNKLSEQLSDILGHFGVLKQIDTKEVPPTAQSIALKNVMAEDEVTPSLAPEQVVANAPQEDGGFIRIRPVLE